ncbi:unnamed protein product [Calicophoron daubneyi]|uniref:CID domain-containing protein n=1 Tax=Calicophoron daubneyi TaxID=300641 RepID=A0AAV2TAY7_CALDB
MTFSEEAVVDRLQQLDDSQVSVESTSSWFLSLKDKAKDVVKLWFKEFRKAPPKKKIAFLHLVNDVVQNGAVTAPQFRKLFEPVLPTAFKETAKVQRHSVRSAVAHLLIVWAARRVYSKSFLRQLRFICQRAVAEADTPDANEETKRNIIAASPFAFSFTAVLMNAGALGSATSLDRKKRHRPLGTKPQANSMSFAPPGLIGSSGSGDNVDSISAFREELARELQTEAIQPPETNELIELLEKLQQTAASGDAATRRAIAEFPPEVSDSNKAKEIINNASEPKQHELVNRISECASRLDNYNVKLKDEAAQRSQLSLQLRAYHSKIRERITQAQQEMEELNSKLAHGNALKAELAKHVSNLPDLHLLPDMTVGLDPLPTVGDLFE